MAARVLLTVDTELTWRHHAPGADWRGNFAKSVEPAGVGLSWQLRLLGEHELKACFFVDPMPALVHGIAPVRAMVEPVLAAGQEVQLHLHPFWASLAAGTAPVWELTGLAAGEQQALIETARALLIEAGAPPPVAFRAGSFGADAATLEALAAAGIRYDSSHDGCEHPHPSALPLDAGRIAPVRLGDVVELPVGLIEERPGRLRHLQICAVSGDEIERALEHAAANAHPLTVLVGHSFELASRDGLRPNRLVRRRFERICRFLADRRATLPTVHCTDLGGLPLGAEARPLPPRRLRTAARMAQQLWGNAVYERAL